MNNAQPTSFSELVESLLDTRDNHVIATLATLGMYEIQSSSVVRAMRAGLSILAAEELQMQNIRPGTALTAPDQTDVFYMETNLKGNYELLSRIVAETAQRQR